MPRTPEAPDERIYELDPPESRFVEKYADLFDLNFKAHIAGVSQANEDGISRKYLIEKLSGYEALVLQRDAENKFDPNAIKVLNVASQQLGWVPRSIAAQIAGDLNAGRPWFAVFPLMMNPGGSTACIMWLLRITSEQCNVVNSERKPLQMTCLGKLRDQLEFPVKLAREVWDDDDEEELECEN